MVALSLVNGATAARFPAFTDDVDLRDQCGRRKMWRPGSSEPTVARPEGLLATLFDCVVFMVTLTLLTRTHQWTARAAAETPGCPSTIYRIWSALCCNAAATWMWCRIATRLRRSHAALHRIHLTIPSVPARPRRPRNRLTRTTLAGKYRQIREKVALFGFLMRCNDYRLPAGVIAADVSRWQKRLSAAAATTYRSALPAARNGASPRTSIFLFFAWT